MSHPTEPVRDEHRELMPYVETLLQAADMVGMAPPASALEAALKVFNFLTEEILPHAYAEDHALYPAVSKAMGASPEATATMSRDHVEISLLTEQLGWLCSQLETEPLNAFRANELRRVLYGLYALLKVHFIKEEEIYLPILDDTLTGEQMQEIYAEMQRAAEAARNGSAVLEDALVAR